MPASNSNTDWPVLPALDDWQDTLDTLHMWTQIVGKVRLAQTPLINHWWNVVLYVTCQGLSTSPMPHGTRLFTIDFDFIDHRLRVGDANGNSRSFALQPMTVADFYRRTMTALDELDLAVDIWPVPVEVETAIPFAEDTTHASYEPDTVQRFWRALLQADRVMTDFRADFIGKTSPVHFFWGAFDLAVTRFSGRTAPPHPGGYPNVGDHVMQEAYSHEVHSAGFWPGPGLGEAAFYAYAYPEPNGFRAHSVAPDAAYYHDTLGEFVLPYEAVRTATDPDATLRAFLQSTYEAAAEGADWNRSALERASAQAG
jgi:hypothetical protein